MSSSHHSCLLRRCCDSLGSAEEGSNTGDDESSAAPSELPSDPPVYQDADAATIQGMHVLPSEELDDEESEWNDENVEDMENATPAQHRPSSGSQLQPLELAAVPHVRTFSTFSILYGENSKGVAGCTLRAPSCMCMVQASCMETRSAGRPLLAVDSRAASLVYRKPAVFSLAVPYDSIEFGTGS